MTIRARKFLRLEVGAAALEYGLLVALIALCFLMILLFFGANLNRKYNQAATAMGGGSGGVVESGAPDSGSGGVAADNRAIPGNSSDLANAGAVEVAPVPAVPADNPEEVGATPGNSGDASRGRGGLGRANNPGRHLGQLRR